MPLIDRIYMTEALKEGRKALEQGEVPVGAIIVHRRQLIGRAHHQTHTLKDPTAHAAMIAITQATNALGQRRLPATTLYVTAKPCAMCAGAIALAGIERVVYGTGQAVKLAAPRMVGRILSPEGEGLLSAYRRRRQQRKRLANV